MYGFKTEPVLITALVGAVLFALVEFGVPLTDGQETAIQGVIAAVLALFARSQVTSQATLEKAAGPDAAAKVEEAAANPTKTLAVVKNGVAVAMLLVMSVFGVACANNPDPTAKPDAFVQQVAKYSRDAVSYVTQAQRIVNVYATAQGGRTPQTDVVSIAIRDQVIPAAERLRTVLNTYVVASDQVAKAAAIKDLQGAVEAYEKVVETVLGTNVPDGLALNLVTTVSSIRRLITDIRQAFLTGDLVITGNSHFIIGAPVAAAQ